MKNKPFFPMFIDLSDKNIVVVGGGSTAVHRVRALLPFTRNIKVIAPKVCMEMSELGKAGYIELFMRQVKRSDLSMAYMVLTATKDRKLNEELYRICKQEGIYINIAGDKEQSDFYFPGISMQGEAIVGVTASGLSSKKVKKLYEEIQGALERVMREDDE